MPGPREEIEIQESQQAESAEDRDKRIRLQAEARVRNVLNLSEDAELTLHQQELATQYEKVIRGDSLTPTTVRESISGAKFKIDTIGRKPYVPR